MTDFFDLPKDDFVKKSGSGERKTDPNIYNPDPNAFNGSYKSVFRFIPYIHDKSMSKYTKYSAKFWNPLTRESLFIDCPSNDGSPSILWDIERVIKSLEKEEPDLHKKLSSSFSRWHTNFSPVYIKKDPQRPELEGTIKFFKFSSQINTMIEGQITPEENDLIETAASCNPYHLLEGKDFLCVVGKKTKTFRDWTKCKFMDDVTPLVFKIKDKQVAVENNEKSVKLVQEFLKKNTPTLDEYLYTPWTDSEYNKVAEAIISNITPRPVLDMVLEKTKDSKIKEIIQNKLSKKPSSSTGNSSSTLIDDDIDFKSESSDSTDIDTPIEPKGEKEKSLAKDEYDSLFDDI